MAALDGGDMTDRTLQTRIKLNNGVEIPILGLGVFQAPVGEETQQAVLWALEAGYRHIDTAAIYANEADVGEAIKRSGIPREQIFVTTKLWNSEHGGKHARHAISSSLTRLGLDYVDLYLIHWPVPSRDRYVETWSALERIHADGRARTVGVSNFRIEDLQRLEDEARIRPTVNQIELHPRHQQSVLRAWQDEHEIVTEAWSPLAQGQVLDDPTIAGIAEAHGKTPAQTILRWHLQLGNVVFPKSVTPERIRENFDLFDFELCNQEMERFAELDQAERIGPDPTTFALA
jgi:2,5-diketo-D-gluconate reductase A